MDSGNDKQRLLIENLPDAFAYHQVVTDSGSEPVDYIFLDVNRAFEEMTGLSREQVKGKKVTELHPGIENSRFDWIGTYGRVAFTGRSISFEQYFEIADRWYAINACSDEPGYFAVLFSDITERKQAEEKLEEEHILRMSLLDNIPGCIALILQKETREIVASNKAAQEIGAVPGEKCYETCAKRNDECPFCLAPAFWATGEQKEIEVNYQGTWYQGIWAPLSEELYVHYIFDITDRKQAEEALRESEEKFRTYIENAPVGVFVANREGKFIEINHEACIMRGYTKKELLKKTISDIIHPEAFEVRKHFEQVQEKGRARGTLKGKRKDGSIFWYDNLAVKLNEDLYISFQSDITERVEAEKKLKESEEKFRTIFDQNIVAIYLHDFQGNIIDVNNQACLQLGYYYEELLEMSVFDFIYTKEGEEYLSNEELLHIWQQMDVGERITVEDVHQRKDGTISYVEVSTGVISYNNKNIIMALVKDITERKKAEEKIKYLSFHDSLTGLYNRAYVEEEMQRLDTERQLPISIIMVDLNGLKLVNDVYGHETGDEMLKSAAKIINKSCRREDIVGRWGGDEFVILLPQTPVEEVEIINKRIRESCRGVNVKDIPVSLAVGSDTKDSTEKNLEAVLKEAEDGMYKQKLAEQKSVRGSVLNTLLKTLKAKSYETEEHTMRMVSLAWKIGEKIGLVDTELNRLNLVITLHDIGKINIPEKTLTKEGSLTDEEWEIIKTHPEVGYRITRASEEFSHVSEDILAHHERWDGKGYPKGLKEKEIPLLARITAIVDAYDVMSNRSPYKKTMSQEEIITEVRRGAGTQFDPELVEIFLSIIEG